MENKRWMIEETTGYKPQTTLYEAFCVADLSGSSAIQETYRTAFDNSFSDYKRLTELSLVLNWKIWEWIEHNIELGNLYDRLWRDLDAWCLDNLTGKHLDYYIKTTIK